MSVLSIPNVTVCPNVHNNNISDMC